MYQGLGGIATPLVPLSELSHDISNRYPHPRIVGSNSYSKGSSTDAHSVACTNCMLNSNDFLALEDKQVSIGWECKPFEFLTTCIQYPIT
jgi:hypothetical protein